MISYFMFVFVSSQVFVILSKAKHLVLAKVPYFDMRLRLFSPLRFGQDGKQGGRRLRKANGLVLLLKVRIGKKFQERSKGVIAMRPPAKSSKHIHKAVPTFIVRYGFALAVLYKRTGISVIKSLPAQFAPLQRD